MDQLIFTHGRDIVFSEKMRSEQAYVSHGITTVYEHSLRVTEMAVAYAKKHRCNVDMRSLIRGALLHDYYLYDWHTPEKWHKWHGFRHARFALNNALADYELNEIEKDIILSHMFPLNLRFPKTKEAWIVTMCDKCCATRETLFKVPNRSLEMEEKAL